MLARLSEHDRSELDHFKELLNDLHLMTATDVVAKHGVDYVGHAWAKAAIAKEGSDVNV